MDGSQFDILARSLWQTLSRRRATRLLGGIGLSAPLALSIPREAPAKGKKRGKKKKKKGNQSKNPPGGCASGQKPCDGGCIPSGQCCNTSDCPGTGRICSPARQCCTKNGFPDSGSATNCCSLSSGSGICQGQTAGAACSFGEVCQTGNCVEGACSSCPEVFDTCARSAETCAGGKSCLKTVDGTTRCGVRNLTVACNGCTTNADCGPGGFCVIDTGPNATCTCATGQTFCAGP